MIIKPTMEQRTGKYMCIHLAFNTAVIYGSQHEEMFQINGEAN